MLAVVLRTRSSSDKDHSPTPGQTLPPPISRPTPPQLRIESRKLTAHGPTVLAHAPPKLPPMQHPAITRAGRGATLGVRNQWIAKMRTTSIVSRRLSLPASPPPQNVLREHRKEGRVASAPAQPLQTAVRVYSPVSCPPIAAVAAAPPLQDARGLPSSPPCPSRTAPPTHAEPSPESPSAPDDTAPTPHRQEMRDVRLPAARDAPQDARCRAHRRWCAIRRDLQIDRVSPPRPLPLRLQRLEIHGARIQRPSAHTHPPRSHCHLPPARDRTAYLILYTRAFGSTASLDAASEGNAGVGRTKWAPGAGARVPPPACVPHSAGDVRLGDARNTYVGGGGRSEGRSTQPLGVGCKGRRSSVLGLFGVHFCFVRSDMSSGSSGMDGGRRASWLDLRRRRRCASTARGGRPSPHVHRVDERACTAHDGRDRDDLDGDEFALVSINLVGECIHVLNDARREEKREPPEREEAVASTDKVSKGECPARRTGETEVPRPNRRIFDEKSDPDIRSSSFPNG
ncbi:hypothetical protein C8R47DRAFT_1064370 [Mycena vitilis]|nr:hypothetical protein C8R47DRAFT_1064370 [Mycena vitilis]